MRTAWHGRIRWRQTFAGMILAVAALTATGCAHAISEALRGQADTAISFSQLLRDPEAYKDRIVILGGELLQVENTQDGTLLEVLQRPLGPYERPLLGDRTDGRYMALCSRYLDAEVYQKGREITLAGRVLGKHQGRIGQMAYTYPLISCLELHLWTQAETVPYGYDPYPWWRWDPWLWDPWYRRPYGHPFLRP